MPQPRKSSPRRRDRRSRSRSHSPRRRRSRSRSRDRRRSRSPQRRRSPERKYRSPPRRKSPSPRKRSRSPKRRSRSHSPRRSRSHSPRRKGHSPRRRSPSPGERGHPVKRPADSSGKRSGFRSRTPSPSPVKRSREERLYDDEAMYGQPQRSSKQARSPVHDSYGGKMYADQPSSSKQPLFPSGSSKRVAEIDYVIIVEKGPKREKLNKRFETHDQVAQGAFDFEENITIGIHRGPQHIELNDDDDIEVNYDFNPKTFKMLFPKKDYVKTLFDRDEIKAFHHDDILDEEAYVEKRTISIKPVDKPKSRRYNDDLDYKITVGSNREGYGDRRMVQDSGSRSRPSRSSGYDDIPVTVRLDPKPDPRYEKMYRDQQRHEDLSLMQEKVHRNPNDLRYNLMRRKSDGERDRGRDSRERQTGQPSMMDARSRIEARRQESHRDDHYDRRDRAGDGRDSPSRRIERKKATVKIDLPDFKNRPEKSKPPEPEWKINPTVTPKGQSYYEHDSRSRDDMTFWERKQMFRRTGRYPSARGGFRDRGVRGGRGRGGVRQINQGFVRKSFGAAAMDEWKHDKFDEVEADEKTDKSKERKGDKKDKRSDKSNRSSRKDKDSSSRKDKESNKKDLEKEREQQQNIIMKEEDSLNQEIKVEVMLG